MKAFNFLLIMALFFSCTTKQSEKHYTKSEVVLNTSTGDLYGTLTIAESRNATPLVIIIPGSGAPDRDGNMLPMLNANTYKMLAETLAEKGISTLRYDKRGVAKSKKAMVSERELRFITYVADVEDWVGLLKNDDRFSAITLLGHSEGSLMGMLAAIDIDVSSFISVAGVGKSIDKLLKEQLKSLPPLLLSESIKIIDSLQAGKTISKVDPNLNTVFRPSVQPYLISWMKYDPAIEITKLKIPTLIIQGTTDMQVTVHEAQLLSKAKPDAELIIIDNMNHVLKESTADVKANTATYKNPELPLKPELVENIIRFVKNK